MIQKILLLFLIICAFTNTYPQTIDSPKVITAVRVNTPPVIDGSLNDSVWSLAIPINDFRQRQPKEGAPSTEKTVVKILYDNSAVYFGIYCYVKDANSIVANGWSWDFNYGTDDNFKIILDTYHDRRNGFLFIVNPNGAQYDALVTDEGNGVNSDWNGIWFAKTSITPKGWFAEIKIPFSTLRFSSDSIQTWGINFERIIQKKNEQTLWTGFGLNSSIYKLTNAGLLLGLRNIKQETLLKFKPYLLGGIQKAATDYSMGSNETNLKYGLDMQYSFTPTLTLAATFNTDFAQVESDHAQINLSRFPLYFPEKREFFLDGADIFSFMSTSNPIVFYSRRIGLANGEQIPIMGGLKLVGKLNNYDIGVFDMQTAAKDTVPTTNYGVFRLKREILNQSFIGMIYTDKETRFGYNRVIGSDIDLKFSNIIGDNNIEIGSAVAGSFTPSLKGDNLAYRFYIDYPNDLIDHYIGIRSIQQNFNPEIGFVERRGKEIDWHLVISPRPHAFGIRQLYFKPVNVNYYLDTNNKPESAFWEWRPLGFTTESGEYFEFNIQRKFDRLDEKFNIFDSTIIPQGRYLFTDWELQFETNQSRNISGFLFYNWGGYYGGKRKELYCSLNLIASSRLSFSFDYQRNDIRLPEGSFVTHELEGRINYSFSTFLYSTVYFQWNNEDNEINMNFRIHWIPTIGSDAYLVYNHLYNTRLRNIHSEIAVLQFKYIYFLSI